MTESWASNPGAKSSRGLHHPVGQDICSHTMMSVVRQDNKLFRLEISDPQSVLSRCSCVVTIFWLFLLDQSSSGSLAQILVTLHKTSTLKPIFIHSDRKSEAIELRLDFVLRYHTNIIATMLFATRTYGWGYEDENAAGALVWGMTLSQRPLYHSTFSIGTQTGSKTLTHTDLE
jgi:hypothetical protein